MNEYIKKRHIDDGAYAQHDGYTLRLYTSNGIEEKNNVYFEPRGIDLLFEFLNEVLPSEHKAQLIKKFTIDKRELHEQE